MVAGEALVLCFGVRDMIPIALTVALAVVGSLIPDIDHPNSTVSNSSRTAKKVSSSISVVTQHRGFTHTLVFVIGLLVLVGYVMYGKVPYDKLLVYALGAGMLSHLILDTMNEKGILWLWPLYRGHIHIAKIRTGSKWESFIRVLFNLAATVGVFYILYLCFKAQFFS